MWARIQNGAVAEITDIDPKGRFHPSIQWEPATSDVAIGDLYDGEAYSKPLEPLADLAARKRGDLETGRKTAELQGITHNGIRYAGDPANRQALREAVEAAKDAGMGTFSRWKDSNGEFHTDHPVADVWAALRAIAARRSHLIEREGELNADIDTALAAEDRAALEAIEWSEA